VSVALTILDESGAERVLDSEPPWTIGGGTEVDFSLPDAPEGVLALIACEDEHCFVQPMDPASGLHRNGRPVGASVWLEDGDRLIIGGHRLLCHLEDGTLRLEHIGRAAASVGPAPATGTAEAPAAPAAPPPDYRPRPYTKPEPTAYRKLRYAIYAGFALLAAAVGFVLLAVPLEVTVTPSPESLDVDGFPPAVTVAGRRLVVPGDYRIEARLAGYKPLSETVEVGRENTEFTFEMEKLPGRLFLEASPPEAEAWVSIDGETIGQAPLEGREVPAGPHRLRVSAERYLPAEREIMIEGMGKAQRFQVVLAPAWADVTIRSVPMDARVLLDGEEIGRTPLTWEVLRGTYTLRLEKPDYAPAEMELEVAPGEGRVIGPVELVALPGHFVLSSNPSGANFTVGDRFVGKGPVEVSVPPRRPHQITAMLPGYKTAQTTVTLAPDERRRVSLELEPEYGTVFVRADPPDAQLAVDGEVVGRAVQRLRLQTVAHTLRITKDGYAPFETTVIPKAGLSNEVAVTLRTLSEAERLGLKETITTAGGQTLKLFGPGAFTMGAARNEPGRRANEREQEVALTRRFYLAEKPVTNEQFRAFRSEHSSGTAGRNTLNLDDQPVAGVSWEDAVQYLNWLSRQDGLEPAYEERDGDFVLRRPVGTGYRLPTEAEWAWVARAAERSGRARYGWGGGYPPAGKVGNFADESARGLVPVVIEGYNDGAAVTAPVGSFPANPAGLYDMGNNIAEWMTDYYDILPPSGTVVENPVGPQSGSYRVVRGASWRDATVSRLRLAFRDYSAEPRDDIGFRVARYAKEP